MSAASEYAAAAAQLISESGCTVREWRTDRSGTAYTRAADWGIEVPTPTTAHRFGVLAHEVGHQVRHRSGSRPRWQEEAEADEYALAQFDRFGLPGRAEYEAVVARHLDYSFAKAVRRGASPQAIAAAWPSWWQRALALGRHLDRALPDLQTADSSCTVPDA